MANGQTDVQQLIQGLVPGSVNNGNPNTAYNVAPPATDAAGNWFAANLPTAASLGPREAFTLTPWEAPTPVAGSVPPITTVLPRWDGNADWSPSSDPIIRPPVTAPIGDPGSRGPTPARPNTGSVKPPSRSNPSDRGQDIIGADVQRYAPQTKGGGSGGGSGSGGRNSQLVGTIPLGEYGGQFGLNSSSNFNDLMQTLANSNGGLPGFLQGAELGSFGGILEILDKISEPWVQGDFVQNGNFNFRQLADSIGDKVLPGSVEMIAKLIGKKDVYDSWLAGGYGDLGGNLAFGGRLNPGNTGYEIGKTNPITGQTNWGLGNSNGGIFNPGGSVSFWNNAAQNAAQTSFTPAQTTALQNATFGVGRGGFGGGGGSGGGGGGGSGGASGGVSGSSGAGGGSAKLKFLRRSQT